jgi:hypothetical protein
MDAPDRAAPGHRAVGLSDIQAAAKVSLNGCVTEPFEKAPPGVAVNAGSEGPRAFDIERIHAETVAARMRARYDLT